MFGTRKSRLPIRWFLLAASLALLRHAQSKWQPLQQGYEKNEYWASCRQSCEPGEVNANDDPDAWRQEYVR